ncbi:MAG: DUF2914 domain-containing protein [Gammaproteobacteria bacterium]|nr:DUF2914 domain-containing protein [Gammaproteobacteria bacterium]
MKIIKLLFAALFLVFSFSASAEDGVVRSAFTTAIDNREPVDQVGQLTNDNTLINFFTEIRGMEGHAITHRWEKEGEVKAEVTFNVGGNRWRVWSSKNLQLEWLGNWQVSVIDEGGNVLAQESFAYIPAAESSSEQTSSDAVNESEAGAMENDRPSAPASMTVE